MLDGFNLKFAVKLIGSPLHIVKTVTAADLGEWAAVVFHRDRHHVVGRSRAPDRDPARGPMLQRIGDGLLQEAQDRQRVAGRNAGHLRQAGDRPIQRDAKALKLRNQALVEAGQRKRQLAITEVERVDHKAQVVQSFAGCLLRRFVAGALRQGDDRNQVAAEAVVQIARQALTLVLANEG